MQPPQGMSCIIKRPLSLSANSWIKPLNFISGRSSGCISKGMAWHVPETRGRGATKYLEITCSASQMCSVLVPVWDGGAQVLAVGWPLWAQAGTIPCQAQPAPVDLLQGTAEPTSSAGCPCSPRGTHTGTDGYSQRTAARGEPTLEQRECGKEGAAERTGYGLSLSPNSLLPPAPLEVWRG